MRIILTELSNVDVTIATGNWKRWSSRTLILFLGGKKRSKKLLRLSLSWSWAHTHSSSFGWSDVLFFPRTAAYFRSWPDIPRNSEMYFCISVFMYFCHVFNSSSQKRIYQVISIFSQELRAVSIDLDIYPSLMGWSSVVWSVHLYNCLVKGKSNQDVQYLKDTHWERNQ